MNDQISRVLTEMRSLTISFSGYLSPSNELNKLASSISRSFNPVKLLLIFLYIKFPTVLIYPELTIDSVNLRP